MMILKTLFTLSFLLLTLSSATIASVVDFCVADLSFPKGPAGYPCKNPANLTVNDFVYSGLGIKGNTSKVFKVAASGAFDLSFPALNGLGLSMFRLDIDVGGVVPLHTHRMTELLVVIEGTMVAGFIGSDNTAYFKTLNKYDTMVFPASLLHFQVNTGSTPALAFVSLNSANPGFQSFSRSLFENDLPTEIIHKITILDTQEVKKLKKAFGGTN